MTRKPEHRVAILWDEYEELKRKASAFDILENYAFWLDDRHFGRGEYASAWCFSKKEDCGIADSGTFLQSVLDLVDDEGRQRHDRWI